MRPSVLTATSLTLAATLGASALAGGAGGAARPAGSLFQPGQTWRVTGSDGAGQPVRYDLRLGRATASSSGNWSFDAGQGSLRYQPALGLALAVNVDPALLFVAARPYDYKVPVRLCLGLPDRQGLRGILMSARSNAELNAQNSLVPASAVQRPPKTPDELLGAARKWGLRSGSCTIKRLK